MFQRRCLPLLATLLLSMTPVAAQETKPAAPTTPPVAPTPPPNFAAIPDFGEVRLEVAPKVALTFIKIPAGVYTRGSSQQQQETLAKQNLWTALNKDETPAKEVRITKPFLLSKYEITQAQWTAIMPLGPRNQPSNPSAFKGEDLPVDSASWTDAQSFCANLQTRLGGAFRLPTEAEWEYAARAGGDGPFGLGADKKPITQTTLSEYAWMSDNSENRTRPVGTRKPNAWGLCDMLGNVWEWCKDDYAPDAYTTLPTTNPLYRSPTATERVLRGGCWFLDQRGQRVSLRGGNIPGLKNAYVGFRIVRELP